MSSTEDPPSPEFSDSDREWLEALSGRAPRDRESQATREGLATRAALEQRRQEIDGDPRLVAATDQASMDQMRQKLLQRVRSEGLFERPAAPAAAEGSSNLIEFPWWRRRRPLLALAASLLVGVVAVQQLVDRPDYPEPPTMLGAAGVVPVRAPQARAAAERLAAQLRQAGLRPGLYQRGTVYVVDIQLMAAELPMAQPAFDELGVRATVGFNRVEISAP